MTKTKVCCKCHRRKSLAQFYRRGDTEHGFFSHCKACFISHQKTINKRAKEDIVDRAEKPKKKRRSYLLNLGIEPPQDIKRLPQFGRFWSNAPMRFLFPKGIQHVAINENSIRRITF